MKNDPKISVCMIVKDEEKLLEACLQSINDIVYEIIIVDTGSKDNTIEIAKKYSANIFSYTWDNSFSNARNYSINKAKGDWLLLLDADEQLVQEDKQKLLDFIKSTSFDGAHFKMYNYIGEYGSINYTTHNALRLLKNTGEYYFVGDIHEQIARKDGQKMDNKFALLDVRLKHYGYLDNIVKEKR